MSLLHYLPQEQLTELRNQAQNHFGCEVSILSSDRCVVSGPELEMASSRYRESPINSVGRLLGYVAWTESKETAESAASAAGFLLTQILQRLEINREIAELSAEIVHSYRILNVIYELNRRLSTVQDTSSICQLCLELTLEGIESDRALLALRSPSFPGWEVRSLEGYLPGELALGTLLRNPGLDRAAEKGESILCDEDASFPQDLDEMRELEFLESPMLWVPICSKGEALGFIWLVREDASQPYPTDDLKLLQAIAAWVATVIQNVQLVQDLQRSLKELQDHTETIEEMQQALMSSQKISALGQLAAAVVHDIKNPLTVISAYAQMLSQGEMIQEAPQFATSILQATEQVTQIVTRILDFYRHKSSERKAEDLNELIENLLVFSEYYLSKSKNIDVHRELEPELPKVNVDRGEVQEVLFNIIMNACHAMEEGGTLSIRTRLLGAESSVSGERSCAAVSIADTGCGIPPEQLTQIFKPFVTTKGPGQGTGLGLAICQRVITEHGGTIEVESEVGIGTTFHIHLPVEED